MTLLSQKILFSIASILSLIVFLYSDWIVSILFNDQWSGINILIQIVFLLMGIEYFNSIIIESLRAKGRFKELAITYFIGLLFICPFLYFSVRNGVYFYTLVRCISLYLYFIGVFYFSRKYCYISFSRCVKNNKFILLFLGIMVPMSLFIKIEYSESLYYMFVSVFLLIGMVLITFLEKKNVIMIKNILNVKYPWS